MARYYYKVWVDVPDEDLTEQDVSKDFTLDYSEYADCAEDQETNVWHPDALARIVMGARLGPDEDYGFDYTVDYEAIPTYIPVVES